MTKKNAKTTPAVPEMTEAQKLQARIDVLRQRALPVDDRVYRSAAATLTSGAWAITQVQESLAEDGLQATLRGGVDRYLVMECRASLVGTPVWLPLEGGLEHSIAQQVKIIRSKLLRAEFRPGWTSPLSNAVEIAQAEAHAEALRDLEGFLGWYEEAREARTALATLGVA